MWAACLRRTGVEFLLGRVIEDPLGHGEDTLAQGAHVITYLGVGAALAEDDRAQHLGWVLSEREPLVQP
jgi:hypothetical protein